LHIDLLKYYLIFIDLSLFFHHYLGLVIFILLYIMELLLRIFFYYGFLYLIFIGVMLYF